MYQKKSWTPYEDEIIRKYVQQMGDRPRWKSIAQKLNQVLSHQESSNLRTPKQCRQRWHNKLDPQILDRQWDQEQINKLFQLHNEHGNKWSLIATMMNGRTDNCVKNKFYSALRKGMRKINKYIVNLKRKLAINKNICIKEFKDVVLTKLIAVADKKYKDKLDVKENSQSKTEKLSEAIKLALVKISSNEDDYIGHVQNGVPDDNYEIQENLFKNIQEFCRNCKRKKGKRKDSDQDEPVSQMVEQSQQIAKQSQIVISKQKDEVKVLNNSPLFHVNKEVQVKTQKNILFNNNEDEKSKNQNNSTFQDLIEAINASPRNIDQKSPPHFTPFVKTESNNQNWLKLSTQESDLIKDGFKQNKSGLVCDSDFLKNIRCVVEPTVQFQKTDHNNKQPENFRINDIFLQFPMNPLQMSNNNLSLASSNRDFFGERSGSLGFLGHSRGFQNPFDFNPAAVIYNSSSYSSSSNNKQHEKVIQIPQSLQKKDDKSNLQRSSQNLKISSSFQLEDLFRRASQRP